MPLLILDPAGVVISANPAAQALVGRRSLSGTALLDLVGAPDRAALESFVREVATLPGGHSLALGPLEVQWSGTRRRIQLTGSLAQGSSFLAVLVALQELPAQDGTVTAVGPTDPLTGVATHSRGHEALEAAVSRGASGCLLVVDLDAFAELNATLGHADGDRVLVGAARRLVQVVPASATVARYDGDTFLVVSPETPLDQAEALARAVLAALATPMEVAGTRVVTASIGVSSMAASSATEALSRALRALQDAKDRGGRQVVLEGTSARMFVRRRSDLIAAMRELESDIKGLASDVERARAEARTDVRTGLANYRRLAEDVAGLHDQLGPGAPIAALFVDLDEFGLVNKSLGHAQGDRALVAVAQILARECRDGDLLYSHAGDQFVVLLPEADLAGGLVVGERLRSAVEAAAIPHHGRPDLERVTISVGVAAGTAADADTVVDSADRQSQLAKLAGRNRVFPDPGSPPPAPPSGGERPAGG